MIQVGTTENGQLVLAGVFKLTGTHGIPLEVVLQGCQARGWLVSWPHYVAEAQRDGAKIRTIRARVLASVGEVYGPQYVRDLEARWEEWFGEG